MKLPSFSFFSCAYEGFLGLVDSLECAVSSYERFFSKFLDLGAFKGLKRIELLTLVY